MEQLREVLADNTPAGYDVLWSCPWCMGFHVSALVTLAAEIADRHGKRDLFLLAAMPWAISTVAGLLAEREVN